VVDVALEGDGTPKKAGSNSLKIFDVYLLIRL
jgi:hypothetical protein